MSLFAQKGMDGEAAGVVADGPGGCVGPSSEATGMVGDPVGLRVVDEAVSVAICCVDVEEACEAVSGPGVKGVSG